MHSLTSGLKTFIKFLPTRSDRNVLHTVFKPEENGLENQDKSKLTIFFVANDAFEQIKAFESVLSPLARMHQHYIISVK